MSTESPVAESGNNSRTEVAEDQLGSVVQSHYNNLRQTDLRTRSESRIYYLRNFNNWIKSTIINEFLARIRQEKGNNYSIGVPDLGCCKGKSCHKILNSQNWSSDPSFTAAKVETS